MSLLLDTHTLLWWLLADKRLSDAALAALSNRMTTIIVSSVCGSEIATKFKSGKLAVPQQLAVNLAGLVVTNGWRALTLTIEHAQLAARLPGSHKDPFDRMLAAQAIIEGVPLVTNDAVMTAFGAQVVW